MAFILDRIGQLQFSTLISIADDDVFDIEKHQIIKRFTSSRNPFSFHPIVIVADPFLFVLKNELYLFYEEQIDLTGKGVIKMTKTRDLKNWEKPIVVLEESFHLSFPNVFEMNGQIYMVPETGFDNSVSLYKPNEGLTRWTYHKSLLTGRHFVDTSIILYKESYYLFTTDYTNKTNVLRLYYADSLEGTWAEHPQSPIAEGTDTGRCAGSLFIVNGILYRPCQLTSRIYGEGVDIYEVVVLNKNEYKENRIKSIIPNKSINYKRGGHHFNVVYFYQQLIVATDILQMRLNLIDISKRISAKYFGEL